MTKKKSEIKVPLNIEARMTGREDAKRVIKKSDFALKGSCYCLLHQYLNEFCHEVEALWYKENNN